MVYKSVFTDNFYKHLQGFFSRTISLQISVFNPFIAQTSLAFLIMNETLEWGELWFQTAVLNPSSTHLLAVTLYNVHFS